MLCNTHTCGLISVLWHTETHATHKGIDRLSRIEQKSNLVPLEWRNTGNCHLPFTFVSRHRKCVKTQSRWPRRHWTTDNPSGMHRLISTPSCANFELHPGSGNIHMYGLILMLRQKETHAYIHANTDMHTYLNLNVFVLWHREVISNLFLVRPGFEAGHLRHPLANQLIYQGSS